MTWRTDLVPEKKLLTVLSTIRRAGGTVTRSFPCAAGLRITYVTAGE